MSRRTVQAIVLGLAVFLGAADPGPAGGPDAKWPAPPEKPASPDKAPPAPNPAKPVAEKPLPAEQPMPAAGKPPAPGPAVPPLANAPLSAADVQRLVAALGHDDWGEREKASLALRAGLVEALSAVMAAAKGAADPEIRSRAQALIDEWNLPADLLGRMAPLASALAGPDLAKRKEAASALEAFGMASHPILERASCFSPEAAEALARTISKAMTLSKEARDELNRLRFQLADRKAPRLPRSSRRGGQAASTIHQIAASPEGAGGGKDAAFTMVVPESIGIAAGPGVLVVIERKSASATEIPSRQQRWRLEKAWPETDAPDGAAIAAGMLFLRFSGGRLLRFDLATGKALDAPAASAP
ncbi:MAG: hypothetical protein AAB215_00160 [Planctomycetota bacterium]